MRIIKTSFVFGNHLSIKIKKHVYVMFKASYFGMT